MGRPIIKLSGEYAERHSERGMPAPSRLIAIAFATGRENMCQLLEGSTAKRDPYEDDSEVLMLLRSQAAARMSRMYLPSHGLVHYLQPV